MEVLADVLAVFGRMHPLLLHLPIGMLLGLGLLEWFGARRGQAPMARGVVLVVAISAIVGAASGWMLHEEDGYASSFALEWHERLGIATAFGALFSVVLRFRGKTTPYRWMLLLTIALMVPAGHFGAEMTHGKGFLWEPLEEEEVPVAPIMPEPSAEGLAAMASYQQHVAPLLKARCTRCHGARKVKGELRLDSPEAIMAGGETGAALGAEGEFVRRLELPLEHDDHMPPDSKTQLTAQELSLLQVWIAQDAPFEGEFAFAEATIREEPAQAVESSSAHQDGNDPTYDQAIAGLEGSLAHWQTIEPGSKQLLISFAPFAEAANDEIVEQLLGLIPGYIEELNLGRTQITGSTMNLVGAMTNLRSLNLAQTPLGDWDIGLLEGHQHLEDLVLSQTSITDGSIDVFLTMPSLSELYVWGTSVSNEGIARLREKLPEVIVDFGDSFYDEPLEVEAELVFTSDAPLVDNPQVEEDTTPEPTSTVRLTPGNTICPVSGKAVDPRYTVVYDGKVIGFCCPNCPKSFWEDPSKYPVN
jgi:YHS domain-containing protein